MKANIVIGLFVAFYLVSYIMTDVQDKKLTSFIIPAVIQTAIALAVLYFTSGGTAGGAAVSAGAIGDTIRNFSVAKF